MKSIAVLGASTERSKFGNRAVRAYLQGGFKLFPVNPRAVQIEGVAAYPNLAAVPECPTVISVYLPPAVTLSLLPEIVAKGCDQLWLNPGADSPELVVAARALGLNVVVGCSIVAWGLSPDSL